MAEEHKKKLDDTNTKLVNLKSKVSTMEEGLLAFHRKFPQIVVFEHGFSLKSMINVS